MSEKTIAFFPEAAFGPALNSVGIAQACEQIGHKVVFLTDPGMVGVYQSYGFIEYTVNMSEPMSPEEMSKYWSEFINGHIPNFDLSPFQQIDNYVKECWEAIVETAIWAQKDLPSILDKIQPDLVCIDNVILFPAIKTFAEAHEIPWVRIISCSENEISDPDIPPHLSGCPENDKACFAKYDEKFLDVISPIHQKFNDFLICNGEKPYPPGQFFETSPHLNLLLYPEAVKFQRRHQLDPLIFQYLEGCVREEAPYDIPEFGRSEHPLLYVSFGSLGAGDTSLIRRLISVISRLPVRALFNVGDYRDQYPESEIPENVHIDSWYPQPSVIEQVDVVIHHGGNNSFNECLYFGKPALIMPYVWDGHDNAQRIAETKHGLQLHRKHWSDDELAQCIDRLLGDTTINANLQATSRLMQKQHGSSKAARLINALLG